MTDEQRKSHGGPPEEYPDRIRAAILHVPFEAINWIAFPDAELRELVEYLGGEPRQTTRRKLQAEARQVVYRFQRTQGLHRRSSDLVKIAPAPGPPASGDYALDTDWLARDRRVTTFRSCRRSLIGGFTSHSG